MKRLMLLAAFCAVPALTGCATSHPQTAEEFRQAVPDAFTAKKETFEVERPFDEVASTFQKMAPKCLNVRVKTTSQTRTSYQVIVTQYKPTVLVSAGKAELHVQQEHVQGVMNVTAVPEGGYYLMVADAYPIDSKRTGVDLYRPAFGHDVLVRAAKGWATGENVGCPDFTQ